MIHWNFVVYGIVALCSLIVIIHNYISSYGGGMWSGGKKQFELDFVGWFNVAFLIVWTLVWGGFYWW
jgi:hypothetical protein